MTLRTLLAWARFTGWDHVTYGGSFGTEHVWRKQKLRVSYGTDTRRLGVSRRDWDHIYRERAFAYVDDIGQAVALLALAGVPVPSDDLVAMVAA